MNTVSMQAVLIDGSRYEKLNSSFDQFLLRVTHAGNVQVAEYISEDREGPPAHSHAWDELEYVIEGEAEFFLDGVWRRAGPGSVQLLPKGRAHSVRVPSGKARVLLVTMGAPYDGFARDLAALQSRQLPATPADVVAVAARHGVRLGEDVQSANREGERRP